MKLPKDTVATVVAEASKKMGDGNYSAVMVGGFVQAQTPMAQFISAHDSELGGAEAIVNVIFHAALIGACFQRAHGRTLRAISYDDLDSVAGGDSLETLRRVQPAIAEFIEANLEHPPTRQLVALLALGMDRVS